MTRSTPRFFNSLDVLAFCDGRTESIWCAKCWDVFAIMGHRMLAGKGQSFRTSDSSFLEDSAVLMKAFESVGQLIEGIFIEYGAPNDVAEIKIGSEGTNHRGRNMAFNR